ncbi:MAG: PAS domain S-box protein [Firmicutes bacterium]|nr:PAS domain S-box protein [Bacillota bacterium]
METAQLYSELKQVKDELERRNQQLADLAAQHERVAQENLKTRRYLEGLLQSVGEAIISFGPDGRVLTWNAAAEQMFGYARADIVGQPFQQLVPASQEGELERVMDQVSAGQALRNLSTERLRKDGEAFPVSITYAPIMGADDRVLAFSALVRDMSPLRNLEQKVKRAEVGSAFAGLLSSLLNELNNRLHSLAMRKDVTRKTPDETHLDALFHSLESALELLRPLQMALAPPPLQRHPASLNALVEEALAEVAGEAAASGVHIDTNLDPAIPETLLDPERVQASVVALLRSGLKRAALSSAKKLRVGTRRAESGLQLACQDSGQAWTEAERTRLFDLASASDAEALVLNLAAQMARAHGGRISARSQEGVGNAFLLELPMSEEVHSATPASLEGRKILVLDDEPFLLECLTDAFQSWGCEATPCAQATDAIDKLQQGSFDLVVSDIRMPGLSGIQFFDWVKANQPAMVDKLLYTTGDSFDPETRAFLDNAKLPHLSKPFDLKKLKQTALGLLK